MPSTATSPAPRTIPSTTPIRISTAWRARRPGSAPSAIMAAIGAKKGLVCPGMSRASSHETPAATDAWAMRKRTSAVRRLAMPEMMRSRERSVHICTVGQLAGEWAERDELAHEDVAVPVGMLVPPPREDERLAANDGSGPVVHLRRHDQVHLRVLVYEQHEDDAVRRRRPLPCDDHAGDGDVRTVVPLFQLDGRQRPDRQVRTEELERVHADRDRRRPVVGEHLLPHARLR